MSLPTLTALLSALAFLATAKPLPAAADEPSDCQLYGKVVTVQGKPWQLYCNTTITGGYITGSYPKIKHPMGCMRRCGADVPAPLTPDSPPRYMGIGSFFGPCTCFNSTTGTDYFEGNYYAKLFLPE